MKNVIAIIIIVFVSAAAQAQGFRWANQFGAFGYQEQGYSVAVDNNKNVYSAGIFRFTSDFDPSTAVFNLNATGNNYEVYLSKLDSNGNFIWAKKINTNSTFNLPVRMTLDKENNICVSGTFFGTTDFDPNAGIVNVTTLNQSIFVLKLDSAGNFLWVKSFEANNVYRIATDADNNMITFGRYYGTADFDPGPGVTTLLTTGVYNFFISKLDSAGNFVFAKSIKGDNANFLKAGIATDKSNNIYIGSAFIDTLDFDPGPNVFNMHSKSISENDGFILKLNAQGNFVWANKIGGKFRDAVNSIAVDANNNLYATGIFTDTVDFDGSTNTNILIADNENAFLSKYDSNGIFIWAKNIGESNLGYSDGIDLTLSKNGNIYTTGVYQNKVDFDPGSNQYILPDLSDDDIFISVLDSAGQFIWARGIFGNFKDGVNSIAIDSSESVHLTGFFGGTVDFNPGSGIKQLITGNSSYDAYVCKFSYGKSITNLNQSACDNYLFNGQNYSTSALLTDTFLNLLGADSFIYMNLIIKNKTFGVDTITVCKSTVFNGKIITANGLFFDTLINAKGCDSFLSMYIIVSTPNTGVMQTNSSLSSVLFGGTYQWVQCPNYNLISGATQQTFYPSNRNSYAVIISENNCKDTSDCLALNTVDITNYEMSNAFQISPNPNNGIFAITLPSFFNVDDNETTLKIYSSIGEIVYQKKLKYKSNETIDISKYTNGVYFLEVINAQGKSTARFVKL
jgi:Secretion system C-terminal sorting domain